VADDRIIKTELCVTGKTHYFRIQQGWIKFIVVDDRTDRPIGDLGLQIRLPNEKIEFRATNPAGEIFLSDIVRGTCAISCSIEDAQIKQTLNFVRMDAPASATATSATASGDEPAVQPTGQSKGAAESEPMGKGMCIARVEEHRVRTGETLKSIAEDNGMTWQRMAEFNWGTAAPDKINEFLQDEVGCTAKTPDGHNYSFRDTDHPGILFIPKKWEQNGLPTDKIHKIPVRQMGRFLVILENDEGLRIPEAEYEATLSDGSKHASRLGKGGVDAIKDPPEGTVLVKFPDLDDIEAKSLAASVRKSFDDRDPKEVRRLFRYPAETVRRTFEAYDKYFNDYYGKGLRYDIDQFFTEPDARMVLYTYLVLAKMAGEAPQSAE
jgi:hypothetical protein